MKNEVRALAQKYPKIQSLMRYVNKETLLEAYEKQQNSNMKERYSEGVDENINVLLNRMRKSSYFPQSQHKYSESSSGEWNLEHKLKVFEDEIVADVFKEILMSIYDVKGQITISSEHNESRHIVNSRHKRLLLPMSCEVNLCRPISDTDKAELITFLEENIADRKFMQYIKRFLQSGILECGNILETSSRELLASTLLRIFIYHRLRGWLTSKRGKMSSMMKFRIYEGKFIFAFLDSGDLFWFRRILLSIQGESGVEIDIKMPKFFRNRREIQYPARIENVK